MREDERTWEQKVPAVLLFVANLPTANIVATSAVLPPAFVLAAVILAAVPFAVPVAPPPVIVLFLRVAALAVLGPVHHAVQHDYGRWWWPATTGGSAGGEPVQQPRGGPADAGG